jgi:hypothetical protein
MLVAPVVIIKHAMLWPFNVIELPFFDPPEEEKPATGTKEQGENN